MKVPREAWWLAGLVIFMLIIGLLIGRGGTQPGRTGPGDATTYSNGQDGVRALYLTLQQLRYDVRRLRVPFTRSTLAPRGVLLALDPPRPFTRVESAALARWVARGNIAVLSGLRWLPTSGHAVPTVGAIWQEPPVTYARPLQPTHLVRGVKRLALRADERIEAPLAREPEDRHDEERRALAGLWSLSAALDAPLRQAVPVLGDRKGAVVAYTRIGAGSVILMSGAWSLSNEGIRRADNLIFALNAIGPPGAPIYFDEYHHGYGENLTWSLTPLPVKVALGNLLLGILLVMYARGRRLGAPVPLERGRRERSEFLGTMTALLRRGHATRLAVRTAYDAAMQRLRTELGLPAGAAVTEVIRAASRVQTDAAQKLGAALHHCRGALDGPETLSEARAMSLIRELDEAAHRLRQI